MAAKSSRRVRTRLTHTHPKDMLLRLDGVIPAEFGKWKFTEDFCSNSNNSCFSYELPGITTHHDPRSIMSMISPELWQKLVLYVYNMYMPVCSKRSSSVSVACVERIVQFFSAFAFVDPDRHFTPKNVMLMGIALAWSTIKMLGTTPLSVSDLIIQEFDIGTSDQERIIEWEEAVVCYNGCRSPNQGMLDCVFSNIAFGSSKTAGSTQFKRLIKCLCLCLALDHKTMCMDITMRTLSVTYLAICMAQHSKNHRVSPFDLMMKPELAPLSYWVETFFPAVVSVLSKHNSLSFATCICEIPWSEIGCCCIL